MPGFGKIPLADQQKYLDIVAEQQGVAPEKPKAKPRKVKKQELVEESFEAPATWVVPVVTCSVANTRGIDRASIGRSGFQQDKVFGVLGKYHSVLVEFADWAIHQQHRQVLVTLTRTAPGELDEFENLPMSFKAIVDAVSRMLGVKDRDKRIKFVAAQEKSDKYGVRIKMEIL